MKEMTYADALLVLSCLAFNEIPRKKVNGPAPFKDTYVIAASIDSHMRKTYGENSHHLIKEAEEAIDRSNPCLKRK